MINELAGALGGAAKASGFLASKGDVDFGIHGYYSYKFFGHTVELTSTHIGIIIVVITLLIFGLVANIAIRRADPDKVPGPFLNIVEYIVETFDNLTVANMGSKYGLRFSNYIGTLFMYILCSNISGLFGLRPPTADYGVTLSLGLITFVLIHYNGFKHQKLSHLTGLFKPLILSPINIIGEIATPVSLSLRLFGNVLSGTVLLGLIYGLLPKVMLFIFPPFAHAYCDVFSGAIQSYVFCMLTMVFISQTFDEEAA